jgi:hypothetical protein
MSAAVAAGYCGEEESVQDFVKRVGTEYAQPRINEFVLRQEDRKGGSFWPRREAWRGEPKRGSRGSARCVPAFDQGPALRSGGERCRVGTKHIGSRQTHFPVHRGQSAPAIPAATDATTKLGLHRFVGRHFGEGRAQRGAPADIGEAAERAAGFGGRRGGDFPGCASIPTSLMSAGHSIVQLRLLAMRSTACRQILPCHRELN